MSAVRYVSSQDLGNQERVGCYGQAWGMYVAKSGWQLTEGSAAGRLFTGVHENMIQSINPMLGIN
jgi:hypothetical protein